MLGLGTPELIILLVVLLLFGGKSYQNLPKVAGSSMKELRKGMSDETTTKTTQAANNKAQKKLSTPEQQTFLEHLRCYGSVCFGLSLRLLLHQRLAFQFKDQLITAVMAPLHGENCVSHSCWVGLVLFSR